VVTTTFEGFLRDSQYTPVPNLLFAELLAEVDDLMELKCILRVVALGHRRKGFPKTVTERELMSDSVLLKGLENAMEIRRGISKAVDRGVLLRGMFDGNIVFALNTDAHKGVLKPADRSEIGKEVEVITAEEKLNIYALYEENIGILTPIIADELKDAELNYPNDWIEDAFREAVERNKRSWRYIESILRRWAVEGREYGESGRYSQKITAAEYIRRYGLHG
jgi:DNA replication protein